MSIRQERTMTEKNLSAHRENARKSRGPATPEGNDRRRDASLRHGFYSHDRDKALRALGEDPRDFDAMVRSVQEKYEPADGFEEALAMRLARAMWRMDRADRMQEGYALRQAKDENNCREDRMHAQMMRLKLTGASLQSLAQAVGRERYVTTTTHLALMKSLQQEGVVKEMGEIALALFLQLQEPGERDKEGRHIDPYEASRRALAKFKEIFGLHDEGPVPFHRPQEGQQVSSEIDGESGPPTPPRGVVEIIEAKKLEAKKIEPFPNITAAQWASREPVRQLLEHILTRQVEICEAQRLATLKESLAGPSPFERAAEIAPTHPNAVLMQRMQDSSFREVWRLSNLLLKMKRPVRGRERGEDDPESGNAPDKPAPPFGACPEPGEASAPAVVAPTEARPDVVGSSAGADVAPPFSLAQDELKFSARVSIFPAQHHPVARGATPPHLRRGAFTGTPLLNQEGRRGRAGGGFRRASDSVTNCGNSRAEIQFRASTLREAPGRDFGEHSSQSENVDDYAGAYGSSPDPLSKARSLASNTMNSGRENEKKDGKVKVYPDKSNRINSPNQARRAVCGHRRSNRQLGRRKSPFANGPSKIGHRQFPMNG